MNPFPQFYSEARDARYSSMSYLFLASIVALGAFLRLWGLGNVGVHGDETLMALAVKGILKEGSPVLPSGLMYTRALLQLYVMSLSAWLFGLSEWALRFPSAMAGTLGIIVAFFLGKRFLPAKWNLLFVSIIALHPWMIAMSQWGRMYIFASTCLMLCAVLLFRWEEDESWTNLLYVFLAFLVAIHLLKLSMLCLPLYFFPFVLRPSLRRFIQGAIGIGLTLPAMALVGRLIDWLVSYRPEFSAVPSLGTSLYQSPSPLLEPFRLLAGESVGVLVAAGLIVAISTAPFLFYRKDHHLNLVSALSFAGAMLGAFLIHYHISFIFLFFGSICYLREGGKAKTVYWLTGCIGSLLLLHFLALHELMPSSGAKEILKALVGMPALRPFSILFKEAPLALVLYSIPFLFAAYQAVRREPLPDSFLFFLFSVWAPLLVLGCYLLRDRLIFPFLAFFILSFVAGAHYLATRFIKIPEAKMPLLKVALAASLVLIFVAPVRLLRNININYSESVDWDYGFIPDLKGAAEFIQKSDLGENDLVIAESVWGQTYYLGKVDYYLKPFDETKHTCMYKQGDIMDVYTSTPLLGSGKELEEVFNRKTRGAIYIVGDATIEGDRTYFLGNELWDTIKKHHARIVHRGRDLVTVVWYLPPPARYTHSMN